MDVLQEVDAGDRRELVAGQVDGRHGNHPVEKRQRRQLTVAKVHAGGATWRPHQYLLDRTTALCNVDDY